MLKVNTAFSSKDMTGISAGAISVGVGGQLVLNRRCEFEAGK